MKVKKREQILGSFICSAIGDGFGYPTEFLKVNEIIDKYGPSGLTEPIGKIIKVTDDTQMALAVCKAIMNSFENAEINIKVFEENLVKEFIVWLNDEKNNRAPGMTCITSCENLERGQNWTKATSKNSKGCGANMRVLPLALLNFKKSNITEQQIQKLCQLQSAITHGHPTALAASELTAITTIKILQGIEPNKLVEVLIEHCYNQKDKYYEDVLGNLWERPGIQNKHEFINRGWSECVEILEKVRLAKKSETNNSDPCEITGEGWIAEEAFATALLCFLWNSNDSKNTLIESVNTKGDSDSIACIAGSFAGAKNGINSIPEDWVQRIEYKTEIEEYAKFISE